MALEKLKFELEEEKAQKSFYQSRHKEATVELQNKTKEVEDAKKKVISLENESMSKQAELKKAKNQLEEKENDIGTLGYDKDTLRNQVKEMQTQADNFKVRSEIYTESAPNNSNETYIFMCLGRASHFGQC